MEASVNRRMTLYPFAYFSKQGLRKMVLVEMDFERFCRARKYLVQVKTMAMAAYSQLS